MTEVGGIVLDLVGTNGTRVVSQLAASSLFVGFAGANPFTIGTQTGFSAAVVGALGGGLAEASVRFTLYDGDTAAGNFDDGDNTLLLNGINVGNWSSVTTVETNGLGTVELSAPKLGFNNNDLDTGFFNVTGAATLTALYNSIVGTGQVAFGLNDVDPFDNFFDFTLGVDGGLINVGQGPTIESPEPATLMLLSMALLGLGFSRRKS